MPDVFVEGGFWIPFIIIVSVCGVISVDVELRSDKVIIWPLNEHVGVLNDPTLPDNVAQLVDVVMIFI